jgi:hypothetical protein
MGDTENGDKGLRLGRGTSQDIKSRKELDVGYQTEVSGRFEIKGRELTAADWRAIKNLFWEAHDYESDWHKDFDCSKGEPHYMQLELTKDLLGIQWDGSEKFYEIVSAVNFVIQNIKPMGLYLEGQFECQGEDATDHYFIVIGDDGYARQAEATPKGKQCACPECGHRFLPEAAQ